MRFSQGNRGENYGREESVQVWKQYYEVILDWFRQQILSDR